MKVSKTINKLHAVDRVKVTAIVNCEGFSGGRQGYGSDTDTRGRGGGSSDYSVITDIKLAKQSLCNKVQAIFKITEKYF